MWQHINNLHLYVNSVPIDYFDKTKSIYLSETVLIVYLHDIHNFYNSLQTILINTVNEKFNINYLYF